MIGSIIPHRGRHAGELHVRICPVVHCGTLTVCRVQRRTRPPTASSAQPRVQRGPKVKRAARAADPAGPDPPSPAARRPAGRSSFRTRTANSTSPRRWNWPWPPSCPRSPPTCGSTWSPRRCSPVTADAADYAGADRAELEEMVAATGFFRNKTNSLIGLGRALVERFDGERARRLDDLVTLPGIRPQDRERGAGARFRRSGNHRRHARRAAGATLGADHRDRPGAGRAGAERDAAGAAVDDVLRPDASTTVAGSATPRSRPAGPASSPSCARRTAPVRSSRSWPTSWSSVRNVRSCWPWWGWRTAG